MAWNATDHIQIWSLLQNKTGILQAEAESVLLCGCTTETLTERLGKKLLDKDARWCFEQVLEAVSHKILAEVNKFLR